MNACDIDIHFRGIIRLEGFTLLLPVEAQNVSVVSVLITISSMIV